MDKTKSVLNSLFFPISSLVFLSPLVLSPFFQNIEKASGLRIYCYVYLPLIAIFVIYSHFKKPNFYFSPFKQSAANGIYTGLFLVSSLIYLILCEQSRLSAFNLNAYDFSIFHSMLQNSLQGNLMFDSRVNQFNHFGIHQNYILFLVLPFYALFQSPFFLQFLSALLMWTPIFPLFFLARRLTGSVLFSLLVVLCYLTSPFLVTVSHAGFRPETFYPLFIFSFLYFLVSGKSVWKLFFILFLCVKEEAAFYGLMLGGFLLFFNRDLFPKKQGAFVLVSSLFFLGVNFALVQPYILAHNSMNSPQYMSFWSHLGTNKTEILSAVLSHPFSSLEHILKSGLFKLYLPVLFFPFTSSAVLLMSLPGILIAGLANSDTLIYQYALYYPVVLFALALFGMILAFKYHPRLRLLVSVCLLVSPLIGSGWFSIMNIKNPELLALSEAKTLLAQKIKPHEGVCVSASLQPVMDEEWNALPFSEKMFLAKRCHFILYSDSLNAYPFKSASEYQKLQETYFPKVIFNRSGILVAEANE